MHSEWPKSHKSKLSHSVSELFLFFDNMMLYSVMLFLNNTDANTMVCNILNLSFYVFRIDPGALILGNTFLLLILANRFVMKVAEKI